MAKVSLSAVAPIKSIDAKVITIEDKEINIVQYLPIQKKIEMIEEIVTFVFDNNGLASPVRTEIYFYLSLIKNYTDITITKAMFDNPAKAFDVLEMNNIINKVVDSIPENEFETIFNYVTETINSIEAYNCSFAGNIKNVMADYEASQIDMNNIMENFKEVENSEVLKDVLAQLN